jgi:diazepam-binding inhibitor (GABA receptor modulator, acyl-CoA-binding protein)
MNFEEAQKTLKNFKTRPTDEELLELYGLYKQAIFGDNTSKEPWFSLSEDYRKWKAWENCKGLDQETAKKMYITKINKMCSLYK